MSRDVSEAGDRGAADGGGTAPGAGPGTGAGFGAELRARLTPDRAWVRRIMRDVIVPIVALRIAIMLVGFLAVAMLAPDTLRQQGFAVWNHWDGPNFEGVAIDGYGAGTPHPEWIVLFPLYPLTISIGAVVLPPYIAGMLVSLICTLVAGIGLYELARLDGSARVGRLSVLAMVLFPTAYSLIAPYSEALFLATSVWAFVAIRRNNVAAAGLLAALAAATRIQGVFLIPALGLEYLLLRRRIDRDAFWIVFAASGLLIYLGINWQVFGSPTWFITVQEQVYHVHNQAPWETIIGLWGAVTGRPFNENWVIVYVAPLGSFVLLAIVTAWCAVRRSRWSYAIYAAISLLSFATLSWPISVPRYLMGVFPIFLAMGSWSRRAWGVAILGGSTLLLGAFMTLFLAGHWAF